MVISNQILLVVSILEGRRFPRRPKHKLTIEAKFDGETLCTDPIEHTESPHFTTELAWELNKKSLHQHKLQRTPIKLQCYAISPSLSQKELVGYIILDLRLAQAKLQHPQWFPLLNSKYQRQKPEVLLRLTLEDDTVKKDGEDTAPQHSTPSKPETDAAMLQPVLIEEKGYYQLGPITDTNQTFLLSITIGFASNLAKLIPSSFVLPDGQGFYFQYMLFGNNVSSEIFSNLLQPKFSAERASVRINAQQEILRIFLENFPGIQITLYCGGHPLGSTVISLQSLLGGDPQLSFPAVVEGLFPLESSGKERVPETSEVPSVGVSVVLKYEEINASAAQHTNQPVNAAGSGGNQVDLEEQKPQEQQHTVNEQLIRNNQDMPSGDRRKERQDGGEMPNSKSTKRLPAMQQKEQNTEDTNVFHHFCYSVDLRSIRDLQVTSSVNCYLKYSYPFFGSAAPVITSPPIEVRRHMEVLLPKSFCAFDFATNPIALKETLSRAPLVVEVWHRDPLTKDVLLGVATVTLGHVFAAKKLKAERGKSSTYGQILSENVHVISNDGKPIGELHVVLGLEDLGPVTPELLEAPKNGAESLSSVDSPQRSSPDKPESDDPRKMAEYQTALELEMWKQQQEELFTAQLQHKEMQHMKTLSDEWKKRDKERVILTKKKVRLMRSTTFELAVDLNSKVVELPDSIEEYAQLEEKLKRTMVDFEKREKQLVASETELLRVKEENKREHERKMVELREASRRMKEDCEHQVEMERAKVRDAEEQKEKVVQQLREVEKRVQDSKEQQMTKPEMKLEAELSLLRVEKVELERKLESANKSKIHYKQQWGKALRELGKVKQNEQTAAKARLRQQEKEIEQMRLRFLAAEEKEIANTEKKELEKIKTELNRLKEQEQTKQQAAMIQQQRLNSQQDAERGLIAAREREEMQRKEELDSRIAKLIEERDTLLQTGVYTTEDRIISELDRQIRETIASKS